MAGAIPLPAPSFAELARDEFERRRESAIRKVAATTLSRTDAEKLLRPWLAIAARLGSILPVLEPLLQEWRAISRSDGTPFFNEREVRSFVADEICPRATWTLALSTARDRAIDRASRDDATPEHLDRAMCLAQLAEQLARNLRGPVQLPAYRPQPKIPVTPGKEAA